MAAALAGRLSAHDRLRDRLTSCSDDALAELVMATPARHSWAATHIVELDGHEVFVKRLPLTDREMASGPTTTNVFGLPVFYSYGVGSAGFGAWRELAAHRQASDLVVSGDSSGFPLLHHHRVMPRPEAPPPFWKPIADYQAEWGGSPAVGRMVEERQAASHELWLVAERLPGRVARWFDAHPDRAADVVDGLRAAAGALNAAGTVHFDAHHGNALTDGSAFYLSDFGLALSESFELDAEERAFLRDHSTYDHALVIYSLPGPAHMAYRALGQEERQRADALMGTTDGRPAVLLDHLEALVEADLVALPPAYISALAQHRELIEHMDAFFSAIRRPDKEARYDDATFRRLLGM